MLARTVQIWFLCGARLFCQSNRLVLSTLLPLIAPELGLDTVQKGKLLSGFPLGYVCTQIVGGIVSDRFGGKPVMALALFSVGFGILAFSHLQEYDQLWWIYFLMGFLEGPSFPTNRVLLSQWIPPAEKAYATAVTDIGGPLGALLAAFGAPLLADSIGWRPALVVCGTLTLLFAAAWMWFGANNPKTCRYIREEEAKYLETVMSNGATSKLVDKTKSGPAFPIKMLAIPEAWSVILAHSAFNYNRYLLYSWSMEYFTTALKIPYSVAAVCMLWPNVMDAVASIIAGKLADALMNSKLLSAKSIRQSFSFLGFMGTGVGAVLLGRCSDATSATICLTAASGMQALHNAGFKSSYGDLSREYSGFLSGVGNTFASGASFLVPQVSAHLLNAYGGAAQPEAWKVVFGSMFICSVIGTGLYMSLVSTEVLDHKVKGVKVATD